MDGDDQDGDGEDGGDDQDDDLSIYLSERVINTQIVDGQPFLSPESCGVACNEHVGLRPLGVC